MERWYRVSPATATASCMECILVVDRCAASVAWSWRSTAAFPCREEVWDDRIVQSAD